MKYFSFDSSQLSKYFGQSFEEGFLQDVLKEGKLSIGEGETIQIYKKGSLHKKLADTVQKNITIEIGHTKLVFDKKTLFKKLHVEKDDTKAVIIEKFTSILLKDKTISHKIEEKNKQRFGIHIGKQIKGNEEQVRSFFGVLNQTLTTASEEVISSFIKPYRQEDGSYTFPKELIHLFILQHFDPAKDPKNFSIDDTIRPHAAKILHYIDTLSKQIPDHLKEIQKTPRHRETDDKLTMQIAKAIFALQPVWLQELQSHSHYQALKISKKTTGLPVSFIFEYNAEANSYDTYIKVSDKSAKGSFKKVSFPTSWTTGESIAFGVLHSGQRKPRIIEELRQEGAMHKIVRDSEHILQGRLVEVMKWDPLAQKAETQAAIVTEPMEMGSLESQLENNYPFSPGQMKQIIVGSLSGLRDLHHKIPPIAHNDLKPGNILLRENKDGSLTAKLADLGSAMVVTAADAHTHFPAKGTYIFATVEKTYDHKEGSALLDDVWALGIAYYQLRHRKLPPPLQEAFESKKLSQMYAAIKAPEAIRGPEPAAGTIDHLIWQMLDPDPAKRLSSDQALLIAKGLPESAFSSTP